MPSALCNVDGSMVASVHRSRRMKLVIFGLTISSSWGNGHATIWRGLLKALVRRGHQAVFFERDLPYYARHRDFKGIDGVVLYLYDDVEKAVQTARAHLSGADVGMVTSYCPDGVLFSDVLLSSPTPFRVFYDLDTPVTLKSISSGQKNSYIGPAGLRDFDLVLSYTGGSALNELKTRLGARAVIPLYGSVDPTVHRPVSAVPEYRSDLSYLGTYAEDRQSTLEALFVEPAKLLPHKRFLLGGSLYPDSFPWTPNMFFVRHVPPPQHPRFYCSSALTLNVTRAAMAENGYCPSGRLFEATACGVPVLSDDWEGLDRFFTPGEEIIIARSTEDAVGVLQSSLRDLARIGWAARERTLTMHTADNRAQDFEDALEKTFRTIGQS